MLTSKDYRRYAREALKGRWLKAGAASIIASLLGASIMGGSSSTSFSSVSDSVSSISETAGTSGVTAIIVAILLGILLIMFIWSIVSFIISGVITLGYAKYNLKLIDGKDPKIQDLFSEFSRFGTGFGMQFFRTLFTFLWSLLFLIPGLIAMFSYSMTPFILNDHPEMSAREAIKASKELMKGNKLLLKIQSL